MGKAPARAQNGGRASPSWQRSSIDMFFLRQVFTAAAAAAFLSSALAVEPADRQFEALARLPEAGLRATPGQEIEVEVDLAAGSGFSVEVTGERAAARASANIDASAWVARGSTPRGSGAGCGVDGGAAAVLDEAGRGGLTGSAGGALAKAGSGAARFSAAPSSPDLGSCASLAACTMSLGSATCSATSARSKPSQVMETASDRSRPKRITFGG